MATLRPGWNLHIHAIDLDEDNRRFGRHRIFHQYAARGIAFPVVGICDIAVVMAFARPVGRGDTSAVHRLKDVGRDNQIVV